MKDPKTYAVDLTETERLTLIECLTFVRKRRDQDYQDGGMSDLKEPIHDPLFVAACELQFKLVKISNPSTTVTLQDYLNYGNYGRSN